MGFAERPRFAFPFDPTTANGQLVIALVFVVAAIVILVVLLVEALGAEVGLVNGAAVVAVHEIYIGRVLLVWKFFILHEQWSWRLGLAGKSALRCWSWMEGRNRPLTSGEALAQGFWGSLKNCGYRVRFA